MIIHLWSVSFAKGAQRITIVIRASPYVVIICQVLFWDLDSNPAL